MNHTAKQTLYRALFETVKLIVKSQTCFYFVEFKNTDIAKTPRQMAPTRYAHNDSNKNSNQNCTGIKQSIGKERRRGIWHEHKCRWCKLYYVHLHPMRYPDHSQFKYQCPNEKCISYHRGHNDTRAYLIEDHVRQRK